MLKNFIIQELVDPNIYGLLSHQAWKLFDPDVLRALQWLRDRYGVATVNNWHANGSFEWSGLRTCQSPYYSTTSMHTVGKAFDVKFRDISANEIRIDLVSMVSVPFITRLEDDVDWIHFDTKVTNSDKIILFKP